MFDLSISKLFVLAVIALVIFGPNELPKIASQAGRALRDLRRIAEGAKNDLKEGLGPEFADFELEDLHPKRFVQKHFLDDMNGDSGPNGPNGPNGPKGPKGPNGSKATAGAYPQPSRPARPNGTLLAPGERPPYDPDAT